MIRVFADTYYFIALLNQKDAGHKKALEWSNSFNGVLVTTEWIFTEVGEALAGSQQRSLFCPLRRDLLADNAYQLQPFDEAIYDRGLALYEARPDKNWSLTDCISFIVMQDLVLTEALTADHHFEQAGFVAMLR